MAPGKTHLVASFYSKSDVGLIRPENQDSFGKWPPDSLNTNSSHGQLFIVADGMGGHRGGKQASQLAVEEIQKAYSTNTSNTFPERLKNAFTAANEEIYKQATEDPSFSGMGTTCTALLIKDRKAYIAHIGDSRAYRIRESNIEMLTKDHTKVAELQRQGILNEVDTRYHPERSILYRALGTHPLVEVDLISDIAVRTSDRFLLCTDGLTRIDDTEIRDIVLNNSPSDACTKLVELANDLDGDDNVTVQVIALTSEKD
jgi:protein phosphatase